MLPAYVFPRSLSELKHIPILNPWFGLVDKPDRLFANAAVSAYRDKAFELANDPGCATFLLVPYDYFDIAGTDYLRDAVALAKKAGKRLIVFDHSDYVDREINLPEAIVFRVSQYRRHLKKNEIVMPYYTEDLGTR